MDALLPFLVPVEFRLISMVRYGYNRLRQNGYLFSTDQFPVDTVDNAGNNKLVTLAMTPAWTVIIMTAVSLTAASSKWPSSRSNYLFTLDTPPFSWSGSCLWHQLTLSCHYTIVRPNSIRCHMVESITSLSISAFNKQTVTAGWG